MEIVVPDEFKWLYVKNEQRPVVKIPDPVLRKTCTDITKISKKTLYLVDEMMRIMRKANGIGLAAPQVGVTQNLIVIAPSEFKPMALINPKIVKQEGEQIGQEGCLSIPGLYGDVKRSNYIEVEAYDRKGNAITLELEGLPSRVVQHEVDHLNGVLFIDKVDPATLYWTDPDKNDDPE